MGDWSERQTCPSSELLQEFFTGSMPVREVVQWSLHIENCSHCIGRLGELEVKDAGRRAASGRPAARVRRWDENSRLPLAELTTLSPQVGSAFTPSIEPDSSGPRTVEALWTSLVQAEIIDQREVDAWREEVGVIVGEEAIPRDILNALVKLGRITDYQSRYVWNGCERQLLLGDYVLLEPIGSGGMGQVFRARQRRLDRIVAIKMIIAGEFASPEALQRFRSEAQAAALVRHPGIVPVYEVGEFEGRHFFSMAYIEGQSLQASISAGPLPQVSAAELIRRVAEAAHYAHQHGVVHRDLKPSNILLDADGSPLIMDFGLAKRLDQDTNLTLAGQILGTPGYMAPEQAGGASHPVDCRTDVYSLGAVLYCALTGRPPFQAPNPVETIKQVIELAPARPRVVNAAIAPDLETICLKCLEKSPTSRYQTAQALAEDLRRFLHHEPIVARPVGRIETAIKWVRRHPTVAGLIATTVVTAVLGGVGVLVAWRQAVHDRNRAWESRRLALQVAHDTLADLVLDDRFDYPSLVKVRDDLSKTAIAFYSDFVQKWKGDPAVKGELAEAHSRAARIRINWGKFEEAKADIDQAVALYTELARQNPGNAELQLGLARSLFLSAVYFRRSNNIAIGERHLREVLRLLTPVSFSGDLEAERQFVLSDVMRVLSQVHFLQQPPNPSEGFACLQESIAYLQRLTQAHPTNRSYQRHLVRIYLEMGLAANAAGNKEDALKWLKLSLDSIEQFPAEWREQLVMRQTVAACHNGLGLVYATQAPKLAEQELKLAVEMRKQLIAYTPDNLHLHGELASSLLNLAKVSRHTDSRRVALELLNQSCQELQLSVGTLKWAPEKQAMFVTMKVRFLEEALACEPTLASAALIQEILEFPTDPQVQWTAAKSLAALLNQWPTSAPVQREAVAETLAPVLMTLRGQVPELADLVRKSDEFEAFRSSAAGQRLVSLERL